MSERELYVASTTLAYSELAECVRQADAASRYATAALLSFAAAWRDAELQERLAEIEEGTRLHRFDTIYGPLIGAAVILGTLALAGVWAWIG